MTRLIPSVNITSSPHRLPFCSAAAGMSVRSVRVWRLGLRVEIHWMPVCSWLQACALQSSHLQTIVGTGGWEMLNRFALMIQWKLDAMILDKSIQSCSQIEAMFCFKIFLCKGYSFDLTYFWKTQSCSNLIRTNIFATGSMLSKNTMFRISFNDKNTKRLGGGS